MSDVRTVDLLRFLEEEVVPKRKRKVEEEQKLFDDYTKEYNNTSKWKRWFKLSQPDSYGLYWANRRLKVAENFFNKVIYRSKCDFELTSLDNWDEWFYEWANENGVPY